MDSRTTPPLRNSPPPHRADGPFADPGAGVEGQFSPGLTKRWFRIRLTVTTGSTAVLTCWCLGFLVQRES